MSNPNNVTVGGVIPEGTGHMDVPLPGDYEIMQPWLNVVRRARQLAAAGGGPALVTITVVTDEYGNPVPPWAVPVVRKLEPSTTAVEAFKDLMQLLSPGA